MSEPTAAEQRKRLLILHQVAPTATNVSHCQECKDYWPCDTRRLITDVDALQAALAKMTEERDVAVRSITYRLSVWLVNDLDIDLTEAQEEHVEEIVREALTTNPAGERLVGPGAEEAT